MNKLLILGVFGCLMLSPTVSFGWDNGCSANGPFSATTGQPCGERKLDCNIGELFSSLTGKPCLTPASEVSEKSIVDPSLCDQAKEGRVEISNKLVGLAEKYSEDLAEIRSVIYRDFQERWRVEHPITSIYSAQVKTLQTQDAIERANIELYCLKEL